VCQVDKTNTIKIADFGLAHVVKSKDVRQSMGFYGDVGTPCYMCVILSTLRVAAAVDVSHLIVRRAPEVIKNEQYGAKCDVFSFGMVSASRL
jgi:serine/threonine protein kinase